MHSVVLISMPVVLLWSAYALCAIVIAVSATIIIFAMKKRYQDLHDTLPDEDINAVNTPKKREVLPEEEESVFYLENDDFNFPKNI